MSKFSKKHSLNPISRNPNSNVISSIIYTKPYQPSYQEQLPHIWEALTSNICIWDLFVTITLFLLSEEKTPADDFIRNNNRYQKLLPSFRWLKVLQIKCLSRETSCLDLHNFLRSFSYLLCLLISTKNLGKK